MRTTASLFTLGLMAFMGCSGSSSPSTTGSQSSAEVCSPTLGPISPDAGTGVSCGGGSSCTKTNNGTYTCTAPSTGGGGW